MTNYEAVKEMFQNSVADELMEFLENTTLTDRDEIVEEFLHNTYNTEEEAEHVCQDFIANKLTIYLEMEKYVCNEWRYMCDEKYTERGLVKIVGLWKYYIASDYVSENYTELKAHYDHEHQPEEPPLQRQQ